MNSPIRVLIADDHAIVRKGIRALLATERDIQVVGEAGDGAEAMAQAQALSPEVILMDLVMPKMDGIEATRQITLQQPGVRILVLTSFAADDKVFPAIKAGALGYLLKDSSPAELVLAIHRVHEGEPSLEPSIARKVLTEFVKAGAPPEIMYVSKPHIGTFRLVGMVEEMRHSIEALGGEIRFQSRVADIEIEDGQGNVGQVRGVQLASGERIASTSCRSCARSTAITWAG